MTKTPRTKKKCVEPERISGAAKRGGQHRVGGGCDQCKDIPKGEIKHCWCSNAMVRCRWPSSSLEMMMIYNSSSRYLWLNSWRTARLSTSRAQGNLFTRSSCWGRCWELMWPLEVRGDEEDFCNFYISIYIGYSPQGLSHISNLDIRLCACYWYWQISDYSTIIVVEIWIFCKVRGNLRGVSGGVSLQRGWGTHRFKAKNTNAEQ